MVKDYTENLGLKGSRKAKQRARHPKEASSPNISNSIFTEFLNDGEKILWFGKPFTNNLQSTMVSRVVFAIIWFSILGKITYHAIDDSVPIFFYFVFAFNLY